MPAPFRRATVLLLGLMAVPLEAAPGTTHGSIRVAMCLAGAWRHTNDTMPLIREHLVEPLDGDVYGVSDEELDVRTKADHSLHGESSEHMSPADMRQLFGRRFVAGISITHEMRTNVSLYAYPDMADAQKAPLRMFPYLYKIWWCGRLIREVERKRSRRYDVLVRLRPDLVILGRWSLLRAPAAPEAAATVAAAPPSTLPMAACSDEQGPNGQPSEEKDLFELHVRADVRRADVANNVGSTCVRFGARAVVIHASTYFCGNDYLAIGERDAMLVTMDLARFVTPRTRWLSPSPHYDAWFRHSGGTEIFHSLLWWRTGTAVHRFPLFIEIARRCVGERLENGKQLTDCTLGSHSSFAVHQRGCRASSYPKGSLFVNPKATNSFDCKGRCLTHPTNHWSGYNPLYDIWPPSSKRCIAQSYPYCKDVDDLRARDALATPCRDRLDPGVYNQTAFHMTDATRFHSGTRLSGVAWHGDAQLTLRVMQGYGEGSAEPLLDGYRRVIEAATEREHEGRRDGRSPSRPPLPRAGISVVSAAAAAVTSSPTLLNMDELAVSSHRDE